VIVMGSTLTYEDTIDGGAGDNTLAIDDADGGTVISNATATSNVYNVSNIKTLRLDAELTNDSTEATIDMAEISGLLNLTIEDAIDNDNNTNDVDVDNLLDGATITLGDADADIAGGNDLVSLDVTFAANSSSNTLTLNLTEGVEVDALTSSDNFIDSATITVADDTIVVNTLSAFTASSITLTGDQTATFGTLSTATTIFDASAATGAVTVVASSTAAELSGGSAGDTLTGGSAADIISGGGGTDTITGKGGIDNITLGGGQDNLHVDDGTATDIIKDFAAGTSGDQIDIDEADLDGSGTAGIASTTVNIVEIYDARDVTSGTTAKIQYLEGQESAADAVNIFLIDLAGTTFANIGAAVDALESGGAAQLTFAGNIAQDDAFIVGYEKTGGGIGIGVANFAAADDNSGGAAATGAANLESAEWFTLEGINDISTLVNANFDWVA